MSQLTYRLKSAKSQAALQDKLIESGKYESMQKLKNFCQALAGGAAAGIMEVATDADAADGTLTVSSSGAQSVTIEGATLTGGTDYELAGTAAQVAANLASAINLSADGRVQLVEATVAGAVVTVTSKVNGLLGNKIEISATGAVAASGAALTGGTSGDLHVLDFGLARSE